MKRIALLSVLLVAAGCGDGGGWPPRSTAEPYTLWTLAKDPCAAITKEDQPTLGVVREGEPMPDDPKTCVWSAPPAFIDFRSFPDGDATSGTTVKHNAMLTTVSGKHAVREVINNNCFTYVKVADLQSFRVGARGVPGSASCVASERFAATVIANLA